MTPSIPLLLLALLAIAPSAAAQFCPLDAETTRRIVACKSDVSLEQCEAAARTAGCAVVRRIGLIHAVVIQVPLARLPQAESRLSMNRDVSKVYPSDRRNWLENVGGARGALPAFHFPDLGEIPRFTPTPATGSPEAQADREQPWGVQRVKAALAWPRATGAGVKVAVIDTGIDPGHRDITVAGGYNAVDPAQPQAWADREGHGTHVAGTIAAKRDGEGVVGVAPGAQVYAVRVLDENGNGTYDDVIAGIDWAVANGMHVANMSLGADEGSPALELAVKRAAERGLVIVAASGNSAGPVGYPAKYPETIAVGASDKDDKTGWFSNKGPEVDFIAPGVDVVSLKMGGGLDSLSGTSMATPHVAGLAALALSMGSRDVRRALAAAATKLPGATDEEQGLGLPDGLAQRRSPAMASR
jgi:subtilisin family serine protease